MQVGRGKRALIWAVTVGFSLAGLLLLVAGPGTDERLAGAGGIALFGGGGALVLRLTRERGPVEPVLDVGRTELLGVSETGVELVVTPPVNPVYGYLFCLGLGVALIALGASGGAIFPLVLGVVLLGLFGYMAGAHFRRRGVRPRVVLTPTGFVFEQPAASVGVRWDDIDQLVLFTQNDVVHLGVDAPKEALVQRDGSNRLMGANRALTGVAIAVPALGLPADPGRLLEALGHYADDPSPLRDAERERTRLTARLAAAA